MGRRSLSFALGLVCLLATPAAYTQSTNSGDIRGTVTDSTGALMPDVTVTIVNKDTGVSKELTTNKDGLFDSSSIVVGTYQLTFAKDGFTKFERSSISVQVGVMTINASLKVGSVDSSIVVNTDATLLRTENAEQSTTFEAKAMAQLPNVGQDWENFTILLPGSSGTAKGSQGAANPGQEVSVNGNLPYSNILADGASTTLSHSANANPATFETVGELQVTTSAFSAQYGIGGVVFNQISKGGTSSFHGSAYDYLQNDALNAAQFGFQSTPKIPFLRYNNFGGSIGGPILKKKMFFYFNYDQTVNHGSASNSTNTVPTEAVKGGDFTGQPTIFDPTTQTIAHDAKGNPYPVRKSFASEYGNNAVPTALFDKVATKFQNFYPTPTSHIAGGKFVPGTVNSVGLLQNNFFSSNPQSTPYRKYFGRLDYDLNEHNRITTSVTQADTPVVYPNSVTACPVGCQSGDVDNYNAQVTDVWSISDRTINEVRLGYTWQGSFYGDLALGKGYAAQLGWQFAKADDLPAIQFGAPYPYAWVQPSTNAVYKEHVFDPSDVMTMIRGKHVLHFGGEFLLYQDNSTAWGNTNAGTMNFSGQYTQQWKVDSGTGIASPDSTTGLNYADFLLGQAQSWNANVSPEYGARLKSPQVFVQDDYKIRPNLTLNVGLRYQIRHGWSETHGNIAAFDPTVANAGTGTLGAYWFASTHANGRNNLQADSYNTFLPRVGFAWQPDATTTFRGGFGIYAYNLSLDTYGGGMGGSFSSTGSLADQSNGINSVVKLDSTGSNLPFTASSTNPARFNGQGATYNEYHTPTPQIYQWNFAMQHELGTNMVAEVAYVASHGLNLNFPTDLNQVPENLLSPNDSPTSRPYPGYQGIGGSTNNAISNYNSLQVSLSRRLAAGLSFNANYTWSHFLDDQDSSSWGSRAGDQNYQRANNPNANYSNSNFDVRNAFKNNVVYDLPFGVGRHFLNRNRLLDEAIGGWQISETGVLSTGNPFTVTVDNLSYSQAGSEFPNATGISTRPLGGRNIKEWYNPAAFSQPQNGTFGNVRRNSLYGPGLNLFNLSAGKKFTIYEQVKLQIRADATNAFNHPSFGVPQQSLSKGTPGVAFNENYFNGNQITSTTVGGRTMQLGARLEF
ncbi:TonB-dependent receptor [Granulicella arctica]|uniref:TonB-dependent receptor n=1 Tax=Granulicella arctica TaxID=940613 RepID=UPI0021E0EB75|nr:TonB-dependent receptor [Granulicella arctica]